MSEMPLDANRANAETGRAPGDRTPDPPDEFYIGYEGGMSPAMRSAVVAAVAAMTTLAAIVAVVLTLNQRPLADSRFEFGDPHTFEGWMTWTPAPALLVRDGASWTRYWLVAQGKFGAARAIDSPRDGWVQLDGTRILRDGWRMLEIVPGTVRPIENPGPAPEPSQELTSSFEGRGEIVDSKCYLGVMNPGERIVHRDCAVRCLSGGIAAMFAYRDREGAPHLALLVRADGRPVGREWFARAGTPIQLRGNLHVSRDIEVLVIDE